MIKSPFTNQELAKLKTFADQVPLIRSLFELKASLASLKEEMAQATAENTKLNQLNYNKLVKQIADIENKIANLKLQKGDKGDDGDNYILNANDKETIAIIVARKIKVPIVEKVIEIQKTEVIKEQPIVTQITKNVPNEISPDEVRNLLELLQGDERLDAKAIKGLPELEKKVSTLGPAFGPSGMKVYVGGTKEGQLREINFKAGSGITLAYSSVNGLPTLTFTSSAGAGFSLLTPTGTVDGVNQTFVFSSAPSIIVVDQGRNMQKVSSDGTVNWTGTTTVILTVAPTFDIYGC